MSTDSDMIESIHLLAGKGIAIALIRLPNGESPMDHSRAIEELGSKVRKTNPDAVILVLPESWSFRTMNYEVAREFVRNMLAFVSDTELAEIGLHRIEETLKASGMTPEQIEALKASWTDAVAMHRARIEARPNKELTLQHLHQFLPLISDTELETLGLQRRPETDNQEITTHG